MKRSDQKYFQWSDLVRTELHKDGADHDDDDKIRDEHDEIDDIDDADHDADGNLDNEAHGEADGYNRLALEQALTFAEKGWRVVPLYGIRQGNCTCKLRNQCDRGAGKHPHFCVHKGLKGADNRPAE